MYSTTLVKGHWYDFVFNYFKKDSCWITFELYQKRVVSAMDLEQSLQEGGISGYHYSNEKGYATLEIFHL